MAKPILLYSSIYSDVAERITEQVLDIPENEDVDLWINSPGGSVTAGWAILGVLKDRTVNMNVMGDAASMAFIMLLFADYSEALETSKFMIHRASTWWESDLSEEEKKDLESRNKLIRTKLEKKINQDEFTKITGKTFDDIFSMEGRLDVWLDAKQAKKIGLISKVNKLDIKEREKIEAEYFDRIAALATPEKKEITNTNINKEDMGIFGSKDPIFIGAIDEKQFAYSKLEVNAKIKATGEGEKKPITGTFEANDKKITVVADVITAIEDIDTKQEQINALSSKITALTALVEETVKKEVIEEETTVNSDEQITALTNQVTALTEILDKAKLLKSDPKLPEGEFKEEIVVDALSTREKIQAYQKEKHEAKTKKREE